MNTYKKRVGNEEFLKACTESNLEVIKAWVEQDGSINGTKENRREERLPIHLICDKPVLDIFKYFIQNGADVNQRGAFGCTPLMRIMNKLNWQEIAELLVSAGADVNIEDNRGWSVLDKMADINYFEQMQWLIHHKSNINGGSEKLDNPLFTLLETQVAGKDYYLTPQACEQKNITIGLLIEKSMDGLGLEEAQKFHKKINTFITRLNNNGMSFDERLGIRLEKIMMEKTLVAKTQSQANIESTFKI